MSQNGNLEIHQCMSIHIRYCKYYMRFSNILFGIAYPDSNNICPGQDAFFHPFQSLEASDCRLVG